MPRRSHAATRLATTAPRFIAAPFQIALELFHSIVKVVNHFRGIYSGLVEKTEEGFFAKLDLRSCQCLGSGPAKSEIAVVHFGAALHTDSRGILSRQFFALTLKG